MSLGVKEGAGFVEGNMPVVADSKQLDIHAAKRCDQLVIFRASLGDVFCEPIGNVGVPKGNVDMVEKVHAHKVMVTLPMFRA